MGHWPAGVTGCPGPGLSGVAGRPVGRLYHRGPGGHEWLPSCRRGYGLQGSGSALALPPGPGLCVFGAVLCALWKAWEETQHLREAWGSLELGWVPLSDRER